MIVCPSDYVKSELTASGAPERKITVAPYGVAPPLAPIIYSSVAARMQKPARPMRVLFAGEVGLRKGILDIANAAEHFAMNEIEFVAAGHVALLPGLEARVGKHVRIPRGKCSREELNQEYGKAVFLRCQATWKDRPPSFTKLLSWGLPVVTTLSWPGQVVEDGKSGFVGRAGDLDFLVRSFPVGWPGHFPASETWLPPRLSVLLNLLWRNMAIDCSKPLVEEKTTGAEVARRRLPLLPRPSASKAAWKVCRSSRQCARFAFYKLSCGVYFQRLGWGTRIFGAIRFGNIPGRVEVGRNCLLGADLFLSASDSAWIRIGDDCSLNTGCHLVAVSGIEIGDGALIGEYVTIRDQNHVFADARRPVRDQGPCFMPVKIGRDVWIGRGSFIGRGVVIGDGCVIGANSVVTRSLPPYSGGGWISRKNRQDESCARPRSVSAESLKFPSEHDCCHF